MIIVENLEKHFFKKSVIILLPKEITINMLFLFSNP